MSELISPKELERQETGGTPPVVIDVRSPEDYAAGHVPGAENIPADELERHLAEIPKDKPVVVY
jgi:rhodanese-related sulfurtransferase